MAGGGKRSTPSLGVVYGVQWLISMYVFVHIYICRWYIGSACAVRMRKDGKVTGQTSSQRVRSSPPDNFTNGQKLNK